MKTKTIFASLVFLVVFLIAGCINVSAQETVVISIEDLRQLRKLAADRDYEKARADEAVRQAEAWKGSAANWQKLYESEKDRADRVQGERIDLLQRANAEYKTQAEADRQRLGELEFTIRKLKSQRKWWFAAGAGIGAAAGVYTTKKFSF
jgi:hypothetical protein